MHSIASPSQEQLALHIGEAKPWIAEENVGIERLLMNYSCSRCTRYRENEPLSTARDMQDYVAPDFHPGVPSYLTEFLGKFISL